MDFHLPAEREWVQARGEGLAGGLETAEAKAEEEAAGEDKKIIY